MANSNTIGILIEAKDKASQTLAKVSSEINQAGRSSEEAAPKASRFASGLTSVGNMVKAAAISFATYKIGQTIAEFASTSVQASAELEQTNMAFQSLTGNVKVANSVFAQLVQYANVTPFESKDVEKAAQTLMSFGTAGQQTVDIIKQIGDVTSVGGGDLQALSLVTGQVFAQGKMRAQDMYQVINDGGAGLIKVMAENAGGMQKLTDEFNNGGIPAKQYFEAIKEATAKGGFAFQGAQKQADTFNGRLSTLKDAATQFGEKLLGVHVDPKLGLVIQKGGLFDKAKGIISDLTDTFSSLGDKASSWIPNLIGGVESVADKIGNYLGPKFDDLFKALDVNIIPALTSLWKDVISPLIPVLGKDLVGAVGLVVDGLTGVSDGVNAVVKGLETGNPVIWGLVTVFGALAGVMAFNAIFDAISLGFANFTLVTVPSVIASFETIAASSAGVAVKQIASFVVVSAQAVAQAAITSGAWIANAAKTSAVWVVTELPKIIASFALTSAKAVLHAADTSLAWVLNATRVSLVWTVTEMPKLVKSFVLTSASATKEAAISSLAWVKNAATSSFAWVTTELPKIVRGFVATSASAGKQALISSAAWVKQATVAAVAWVVTELPQIVKGFVVTTAAAVLNAGRVSAAYVAAAVTSTQSFTAFRALVLTPLVMPAIGIGLAMAALAKLYDETQKTVAAINSLKANVDQKAGYDQKTLAHFYDIINHPGPYGPAAVATAKRGVNTLMKQNGGGTPYPGFALGTNFAPGGRTVVGENGAEVVDLPTGSRVHNARETQQMLGGGNKASITIGTLQIHNNMDEQRFLKQIGWRLALA